MVEHITLARPYAKAIFLLAKASHAFKEWANLLDSLALIVAHPKVLSLIKNQALRNLDKANFIIHISGTNQTVEKNFIKILALNKRLELLPEIAKLFHRLQQIEEERMIVTVKAANKLLAAEEHKLLALLNKKFKSKVEINFVPDKTLLAGVKIKAQDKILDYSVLGQLKGLYKALKG